MQKHDLKTGRDTRLVKAIKSTRLKAGLTRKDIFRLYHIPVRTLEKWESGDRRCPDYVAEFLIERINKDYIEINIKEEKQNMYTRIKNLYNNNGYRIYLDGSEIEFRKINLDDYKISIDSKNGKIILSK